MTIDECFELIDDDKTKTISLSELKMAIIRFDLNLTDRQAQLFVARLAEPGKDYISKDAFIKRFWAAYTYEEVITDKENSNNQNPNQNTTSSNSRIATSL